MSKRHPTEAELLHIMRGGAWMTVRHCQARDTLRKKGLIESQRIFSVTTFWRLTMAGLDHMENLPA